MASLLALLVISPGISAAARLTTYYFDADGDGYGNSELSVKDASPPPGYVAQGGDCSDADPSINPGAEDICGDAIDQNCSDGDQACSAGKRLYYFYRDADSDGYGDSSDEITAKSPPAGYVSNRLDCNDGDASAHPGGIEICDGVDNDCNVSTGDGSGASAPFNALQQGVCAGSRQSCTGGAWTNSYAGVGGYEASESTCDSLDNDCDTLIDEGLTGTFFRDADADGFGDTANPASACAAPAGFVANADDCNDAVAAINPAAIEICGDGIDQDCDGADAVCPVVTFERTYGGVHRDWSRNVEQTPDGGFIMAGYEYYAENQQSFINLFAVKTDALGNQVWKQTYSQRQYDYGRVVVHRSGDGYVIYGTGWDSARANYQSYLLRIDAAGAVVWTRYFGAAGAQSAFDFKVTADGGYIMVAEKFTNATLGDVVLVKADALGNVVWSTLFSYARYERAHSVIETGDGGFAFLGYTESFGGSDFYLVKTDALGTELWHRVFGAAGTDQGFSLQETTDGGLVLFGTNAASGGYDMCLVKTDAAGNVQWNRTYGGAFWDQGRDVRQTADGGFILAGFTDSFGQPRYVYDIYLVKTDSSGTEEWSKVFAYPGTEYGEGVELTDDGNYAVLGTTNSFGAGDYDILLIKTDAGGNFERLYWRDADGDGFGDSAQPITAVEPPVGYVGNSTDCNDADAAIHPGAAEIPGDGIDQDCDGRDANVYYHDVDLDGFGNPLDFVVSGTVPIGYVLNNGDCNDADLTIHPGAQEICSDGIDQDCDGYDADVCLEVYFRDADGDGYGNPNESIIGYPPPPPGFVVDDTDCNDGSPAIHPGALEIPGDGIDQDCDGVDPGGVGNFQATFGGAMTEFGYTVEQTMDGGYFLAGVSDSFGAGMELYAVKTTRSGVVEWSNHYGGYGSDYPVAGRPTSDGGYVLLGTGFASGLSTQFLLIKLDHDGIVVWSRTYGGPGGEHGRDVRETPGGGFAIFGEGTDSFGMLDFVLVKTDADGNEQWTGSYGGSDYDQGRGLALTSDGGYVLVGHTRSFGAGAGDLYLVKVDGIGNQQWDRTFGGSYWEEGFSVEQTFDGGYIVLGYTNSSGAGGYDMYLVKTDAFGTEEWSRTYGGGSWDFGWSARQTPDGGYVLLGYTNSFGPSDDMYLIKTNVLGNTIWEKTIGGAGDDSGLSLDLTDDGGYVLLGRTNSFPAAGFDFLLVKTDANGNY